MNELLWNMPLLADWVTDTWQGIKPEERFPLLIVAIGCATGVICTIVVFTSSTINSIHRRRLEAEMKRDMIERGMTADDISKIIEAASPPEDGTQRSIASWAKKKSG